MMKIKLILFASITLVIGSCSFNSKFDTEFLQMDWKRVVTKNKKSCNKYIGSKKHAKDRLLTLSIIDSILINEDIQIRSLEISNWINHDAPVNPYELEIKATFDIAINEKLFYRVKINDKDRYSIDNFFESSIYLSKPNDIKGINEKIEFVYIKYLVHKSKYRLDDIAVYCK